MEDEQLRAHNLFSWINEIEDICTAYIRIIKNYKLFKGKLFYKYVGKYVEAVPLKDKSALLVARGIYEVYCRQGAPVHIISDQGKAFNQVASYIQYSYIFMSMRCYVHMAYICN